MSGRFWGKKKKKAPPAKKKNPEEEEWGCHVCTFLNKPLFLQCEMCGNERRFQEMKAEAEAKDEDKDKEEGFDFLPDFSARLETLYETGRFSDVTFIAGEEEKEISAHKAIVCLRSPVFAAMFHSGFLESKHGVPGDPVRVPIGEVSGDIFENMIRAMYTDALDVDDVQLLEMLFCCDKFGFDFGKQHCIKMLRKYLSPDNAAMTYDQLPGLLEDEKYILDFVDEHADEVLEHYTFLNVSHKTVLDIVQREKLQIEESKLIKIVMKWAERECERRKLKVDPTNLQVILKDIIPHIRFPLLTIEEFAEFNMYNVLTKEQCLAVYVYLGALPEERKGMVTPFLNTPRARSLKQLLIWGKRHRNYVLSSDSKTATYNAGGTRTQAVATSAGKLQTGRYRVRMEHRGGWTYSVGICTEAHSLEVGLGQNTNSWCLNYMGQLVHGGRERAGYGMSYSQCIIEVVIDLSKRTLSFRSINQPTISPGTQLTDHGLAYSLPRDASFYLAVSMDYESTATIIGYNPDVNGRDWKS